MANYAKLGLINVSGTKEVIFSDMGFLHDTYLRDEYDGQGYISSDDHGDEIIPASYGQHLIYLGGAQSSSPDTDIIRIWFGLPYSSTTRITNVNDLFTALVSTGEVQTAKGSFFLLLYIGVTKSIAVDTESYPTDAKLIIKGVTLAGKDITLNPSLSDSSMVWTVKDTIVGTTSSAGTIKIYKSLYQESMRHIALNYSADPTPTPGGKVTSGMVLAKTTIVKDCNSSWVTIAGKHRLMELTLSCNANGGGLWLSPTSVSGDSTGICLEFHSTVSGKTATLTVQSWDGNNNPILMTKSFTLSVTPQYADWCICKKQGRLVIQCTARASGVSSYDFYTYVVKDSDLDSSTILQKLQQASDQFILNSGQYIYVRGVYNRTGFNTQWANFFDYNLNLNSSQFIGPFTITLKPTNTGVASITYRVNSGSWTTTSTTKTLSLNYGSIVDLYVTASSGYVISGTYSRYTSSSSPYNFTVTDDKTIRPTATEEGSCTTIVERCTNVVRRNECVNPGCLGSEGYN